MKNIKTRTSATVKPPRVGKSKQEGVVLIVSLVLLLVMTLIGVSNMRSSSVQLNMAMNNQSRSEAFSAAEYALLKVEADIQGEFAAKHDPKKFVLSCSGDGCYDANCTAGLCYEGNDDWTNEFECQLNDATVPEYIWMRDSGKIWDEAARHQTKEVTAGTGDNQSKFEAKYIIEFLCYTHKNPDPDDGAFCEDTNLAGCAPLYRITVLAESENKQSRVMLQATTKVVTN